VLQRIRASGRPFVLFTNGSHASPETLAAELREAGLDVGGNEVLTPLCSVQVYLARHGSGGALLLLGTQAAREYLVRSGVVVAGAGDAAHVDAVFVAWPDVLDFAALERAARAVLGGARLLTGSYVRAYAGADGPIFSRGAMTAAAIAKATGARPVIVGKPSRAAVEAYSDRLGAPSPELAVIGDDVAMDIALGRLGRSRTVLVQSGTSGRVELGRLPERQRPDAVVQGVSELLDWL
jgi:NagD protein